MEVMSFFRASLLAADVPASVTIAVAVVSALSGLAAL
jgi:hypothetical protein